MKKQAQAKSHLEPDQEGQVDLNQSIQDIASIYSAYHHDKQKAKQAEQEGDQVSRWKRKVEERKV